MYNCDPIACCMYHNKIVDVLVYISKLNQNKSRSHNIIGIKLLAATYIVLENVLQ